MIVKAENLSRIFKTAWFTKAAKKSCVTDEELCAAIRQVMQGQADDLGGGVFNKRLKDNRHRSIIIAKGGKYWIYVYLFAKKERDNIGIDELAELKKLATLYSRQTEASIEAEIKNDDLWEIYDGKQT